MGAWGPGSTGAFMGLAAVICMLITYVLDRPNHAMWVRREQRELRDKPPQPGKSCFSEPIAIMKRQSTLFWIAFFQVQV